MASNTKSRPGERMPRIAPENMTEAQKKAVAEITSGPRGDLRGPFIALLRSPGAMSTLQKVGEYLRFQCPIERRIAEFATLIAARHWTQHYEWQAHYPLALKAGLKQIVADTLAEGRRPAGMAEDEEIVYDLVNEALANKSVCDATYARALAKFGESGIIDLLTIAGYYAVLAMVLNVARTALPPGVEPPLPMFPH